MKTLIKILCLSILCFSCEESPNRFVHGCTIDTACNFDPNANVLDDSCWYAEDEDEDWCDCDGNIIDCADECGGNAVIDQCGICNGINDCVDCGGESETVVSFPFTNTGSTIGLDSDFPNWGGEWADFAYFITLNQESNLVIDLCGSDFDYEYDTFLYLFRADCDAIIENYDFSYLVSQGVIIAYNDDSSEGAYVCENKNSLDSYLNVNLEPGTYYAVVSGYSGTEGDYNIYMALNNSSNSFPSFNPNIEFKKLKDKNNKKNN